MTDGPSIRTVDHTRTHRLAHLGTEVTHVPDLSSSNRPICF